MAEYLHSNDKRKIINALFKYFKFGAANFIKDKQNNNDKQLDY